MNFKLPRKKKKEYLKKYSRRYRLLFYNKAEWEWYYFRRRVEVRCMKVIINYPELASKEELLKWYKEHYPNDKLAHHYVKQLK